MSLAYFKEVSSDLRQRLRGAEGSHAETDPIVPGHVRLRFAWRSTHSLSAVLQWRDSGVFSGSQQDLERRIAQIECFAGADIKILRDYLSEKEGDATQLLEHARNAMPQRRWIWGISGGVCGVILGHLFGEGRPLILALGAIIGTGSGSQLAERTLDPAAQICLNDPQLVHSLNRLRCALNWLRQLESIDLKDPEPPAIAREERLSDPLDLFQPRIVALIPKAEGTL